MTDNRREVEQEEQKFPTHDEIQKRAHELYLARGGEHGQDIKDWLFAEEQLRREHGKRIGTQTTTFVAGPGGIAKADSPSHRDFVIAEEERHQVRAAEELKETAEGSTVPRTKTVSVGQQRKE